MESLAYASSAYRTDARLFPYTHSVLFFVGLACVFLCIDVLSFIIMIASISATIANKGMLALELPVRALDADSL